MAVTTILLPMLNAQILDFLNVNNIEYEIIQHSSTCSDLEIEMMLNSCNREFANTILLNIDGLIHYTFVSANYDINTNRLKETLKANRLDLITDPITITYPYELFKVTLIDQILANETEEILFKVESSNKNIVVKVKTSVFLAVFNPKVVSLNLLPKYRTKIIFVSPESNRNTFEDNENCFFGISLENSHFTRPKLMASLDWISKRFSSCFVLIGDSIHRITLETRGGLEPVEAYDKALCLGSEFLHREKNIFKRFENYCKYNFILCSEVQSYPDYNLYYTKLKNLFDQDTSFQNSVKAFSENYHRRKQAQISNEQWKAHISRSSEYFLEEFAIFACLVKRNIPVMVYPGSFSTLTEIVNGKHPKVLQELKDLTVVSLQLKKR
ncbi:MAG: tRNA-dependent cyclodipeptide synthase [Moorea sp. SIOASIH]|uniref:tRNA-dependent cyclodipeptide synthase n=1 Tax=Moorena sp. SIOASIH TaxID=2607817 RepID=UPI0013B65246|nr:tRNA-dependent cyclodipeptide synthase [Moorena sp. SIOASIH]NEO38620.1 tRNA-dependent cyclodipeptide synthase [Moorena sp. SIOASIH]